MTITVGKPGKNMEKTCDVRVMRANTKRGIRFFLVNPTTRMRRLISESDARRFANERDLCVYLPRPFVAGGGRRRD